MRSCTSQTPTNFDDAELVSHAVGRRLAYAGRGAPTAEINTVMSRFGGWGLVAALATIGPLLSGITPMAAPGSAIAAAETVGVGPFTFAIGPYQLRQLPPEQLAHMRSSIVSSCGVTDAKGVAMYRASNGTLYDHPILQASCALAMLSNYRLDPDSAYLQRAAANAQRLLDRAVTYEGGIFFPYPFSYSNSGRNTMTPPWYSALAQGHALAVFVRLYEAEGSASWLQAASRTFRSFKVKRGVHTPWVVGVENSLLWLDEYPSVPLDRVFNGHNYAVFGLYDYWRVTSNDEAYLLILGALHSTYLAAITRDRVPGGISQYCVSDICMAAKIRNPNYHPLHVDQLVELFRMTAHWHFASLAEAYVADSPRSAPGRASLAAGIHNGYTFDPAGTATHAGTVLLAASSSYAYSRREVPGGRTNPGSGNWLRLAEGPLRDLWVREGDRVRPFGFVDVLSFYWQRDVRLDAGRYAGDSYAPDGTLIDRVTARTGATTWTYTDYARVNGQPSVRLASGPLAGRWLVLDTRTVRDTTLFSDVETTIFRGDIIWLTAKRITRGCDTFHFCPDSAVTREQVASFLARALRLPAATHDYFTDDDGRPAEADINRVAAAGITAGCAPGRYCPLSDVTREQMASLLARALDLPTTGADFFTDDERSLHEADINRLAASGITRGCTAERFCPREPVKRQQMAAFLRRAFGS